MHRTFDIMLEAVHEHGWTINQFLGDRRELATGRYDFAELGEMTLPESLQTVEVCAPILETLEYVESGRRAPV